MLGRRDARARRARRRPGARASARSRRGAPAVTLDDGADLLALLHEAAALPDGFLGATEETTTGLVRARARWTLRCPVLAVNEARTERVFNDRYGTGQSTLDGILRATNLLLAGRTVVVLGYGFDRPRHRRRAPAAPARR